MLVLTIEHSVLAQFLVMNVVQRENVINYIKRHINIFYLYFAPRA